MKKQTRKVLLGAATVAAVMSVANGAYAAQDDLDITAKIIAAIDVTATQALNFGTLSHTNGGTATIDKTGALAVGGTVVAVGGTVSQGQFKVSAAKAAKLDVTLPATAKIANGTAKTMVVDQFLIESSVAKSATPYEITFTAGQSALANINVGARLTVGAAQETGTYTGTAAITVVYQ